MANDALRTPIHTYVVCSTGEHEALLAGLDAWLEAFRKCHGADRRITEVAPPH